MNYYERIQNSIDFIETNLKEEIDSYEIAKQSFFSVTHFYRLFQAIVGDSVKEYVRKRKLSDAAIELLSTKKRIIDIAFEYGFESQEVFTRAFARAFGITPGRYRKQRDQLILYEKVNIKVKNLKNGGVYMEPKIIIDKEFKITGIKALVKPGSSSIGKLWTDFHSRRAEINNPVNSKAVLGLCEYMPDITDDSEFSYFAGIEVTDFTDITKGFVTKELPPSKYALFTHKGSLAGLKDTYDFIYGTWLPCSGYELAELDTIEWYDARSNDSLSPNYEFDIYIPIK